MRCYEGTLLSISLWRSSRNFRSPTLSQQKDISVNRIYQGKVTAVEIPDGKDESGKLWKELPDWQSALWQHHELFQDAVNYYTLALAAIAEGAVDKTGTSTAMADFAVQVKERWQGFTHKEKSVRDCDSHFAEP